MTTHTIKKYNLEVFWNDEFKQLDYENEAFNDAVSIKAWMQQGYPFKFTGDMCDMRKTQPSWNQQFIDYFASQGWQDIGTSYYRMPTGTCLPTHGDLYKTYINLFGLEGQEQNIRRAIVFLEDWKSGHYFEAMDHAHVGWVAGTVVEWAYDAPHLAANMGLEPRYTLQITGHV